MMGNKIQGRGRRVLAGAMSICLAVAMQMAMPPVALATAIPSGGDTVGTTTIEGTYDTVGARRFLEVANAYRTTHTAVDETTGETVTPCALTWDYNLERVARQRAAEIAWVGVYNDDWPSPHCSAQNYRISDGTYNKYNGYYGRMACHIDGLEMLSSAYTDMRHLENGLYWDIGSMGENAGIQGDSKAETMVADNEASKAHLRTMMDPLYTTVGAAEFYYHGVWWTIEVYYIAADDDSATVPVDYTDTLTSATIEAWQTNIDLWPSYLARNWTLDDPENVPRTQAEKDADEEAHRLPTAVSITRSKRGRHSIKLTWSAAEHATGYIVRYKKRGAFRWKTVKVSKATTCTKTIRHLKRKTTYWMAVCSWKVIDGTMTTSTWSVGSGVVKTK